MGEIVDSFAVAFRDFVTAGVPASGANKPSKAEIRAAASLIETALASAGTSISRYATTATRDADTSKPTGTLAYVYANNGSSSDALNGFYQWNGSSWIAAPWFFSGANAAAIAAAALVDAKAVRGLLGVSTLAGAPVAYPTTGPNELMADGAAPVVGNPFDVLLTATNTSDSFLTIGGVRLLIANGGGAAIEAGRLVAGQVASLTRSSGGVYVFNGLRSIMASDIVEPVADKLDNVAMIAEQLIGATIAYPVGGSPNELAVSGEAPSVGAPFTALILMTNTGQTYLTRGGVRLLVTNGGGVAIPAGGLPAFKIATFARSGGGAFVLTALTDRETGDADPLMPIDDQLFDNPYGNVVNNGGVISRTPVRLRALGGGSSIGVAQGGNQATDAPNNIFVNLLNGRKRQDGVTYVSEIVAIPGTGTLDMAAQFAAATGADPERFRTYVPGMNDCYFRLFVMQHGYPAMIAKMKDYLLADAAAGRISIVWTSPFPHSGRVNLAGGMPSDKPMTYPVYKDAPVTPTDVRNALGSDTVLRDWTGGGVPVLGVRTFAHYNAALMHLCRGIATSICIDAAWAFARYGLEPASKASNPATALDALYYSDNENHFSPAGYQTGYGRATVPAVDAILSGDLSTRYFRGDE